MGGGGSTNTIQQANPWSGVQPGLLSAYSQAGNLYQNPSNYPQYYQGTQVAPLTNQQNTAINSLVNTGTTPNPMLQAGQNALTGLSSGSSVMSNPINSMLSPYTSGQMLSGSNPYLNQVEQTAASQITPQVQSQFEAAGRYGSGASANAQASALANMAGNLGYQNYQQGQQNQLNATSQVGQAYTSGMQNQLGAAALAPSNYAAQLSGPQAAIQGASIPQQQQQNEINALMNQWNYNQQLPYTMNSQYLSALGGAPGAGSTTTQPYYTNQAAGALGLGLGGLSMYNGLNTAGLLGGGSAGMFGAGAAALGGTAGIGASDAALMALGIF